MTMTDMLAKLIIPDYCCSCGDIGAILCLNCKYDIINEFDTSCVNCQRPISNTGICHSCRLPYQRSWVVGRHEGALDKLVSVSKFASARRGCQTQAELIDLVLPVLPKDLIIVPIPTISKHTRVRGYGHAERIAKQLAKRRKVKYAALISRKHNYVQHFANRALRQKQAADSYQVVQELDNQPVYLIIDDVFTTGFTVQYAAEALISAGAENVWVAVTSRQPLD